MFFPVLIETMLDLFRDAFLSIPLENPLSIVYVILNFLLQLFVVFSGGGGELTL